MAAAYGLAPIETPPGEDPTANQTPLVIGVSVFLIVMPTVVVSLRLLARMLSKAGFWWDDFMVVFALICSVALSSLQIYSLRVGFGTHMEADGPLIDRITIAENWFKIFYAYQTIYSVSATAAKLSILLFYARIFKEKHFLFWLKVVMGLTLAFFTAGELTVIFECIPIAALWDPFMTGTCVDIITFFVATGGINVVYDTVILLLPLPMIWSLEIERHHKYALSGVFLLGMFVVVAAIVRTVVISQLQIEDITWEFVNAALWTAAEPAVAVTSASLPILRSLWIWNRRKRPDRYGGAESPDSYSDEPKSDAELRRNVPFRKPATSFDSQQKYPLHDLPAGVQQVFGNRVTVASNGQSRKLSDETDAYADLPIMHPQDAAVRASRSAPLASHQTMHYSQPPVPVWSPSGHDSPAYAGYSSRSSTTPLPSNRSELYG